MHKCIMCNSNVGVYNWCIYSTEVENKLPIKNYVLQNAFCDDCHSTYSVTKLDYKLLDHYFSLNAIKYDNDKVQWTLLLNPDFKKSLEDVVSILQSGANKYSKDNWKGLDTERLENAMLRHVLAYMSGEVLDRETNKSHLLHALTNILFIEWQRNNETNSSN